MSPYERFAANMWKSPCLPKTKRKKRTEPEKEIAALKKQLSESDRKLTEALQGHIPKLQHVNELERTVSIQDRKIQALLKELEELKQQVAKDED